MPQCQFMFSAVFGFRKAVMQISSESDETNCQVPIFSDTFQKSEGEPGGGQTTPRRGWALCRACRWFGPLGGPPTSPLRLYIAPDAKTLKYEVIFHEEFRSAAAIDDKFRGTESLFRHAAGTGNCPRSHLHRHHRHLHRRC